MGAAPVPANEQARVAALRALGILDTAAEERFDRITRVASAYFGVPMVAVSLIDANRQWFKSCIGLDPGDSSLETSFCAHAILGDEALVIEDATRDPRFADNPLVTGDPFIRSYAGQPLYLPDGTKPGTLCVIDVQPRRFSARDREMLRDLAAWAERELNSERVEQVAGDLALTSARMRAVMDGAAEGIIVLDPQGRVEYANESAAELLGYGADELTGVDFEATVQTPIEEGDQPFFRRRDGEAIPVDCATEPVLQRGKVEGSVISFRDISEQLALERTKEEFTAAVSHDLRSPLSAVKGYVEMVLSGMAGEISEEQSEYLAIAARSTDRVNRMINDLLLASQLEAGPLELELSDVDVRELLEGLVEQAAPTAHAGEVDVEVDVDAAAPGSVPADGERLERAVGNLIGNAIKFSHPGGRVQVAAGAENGDLTIAVTDQGPGIPPDELEKLGTRFFRASTSGMAPGTGLGLAIAKEIAEAHGGELTVESELGKGSTFRMRLAGGPR